MIDDDLFAIGVFDGGIVGLDEMIEAELVRGRNNKGLVNVFTRGVVPFACAFSGNAYSCHQAVQPHVLEAAYCPVGGSGLIGTGRG